MVSWLPMPRLNPAFPIHIRWLDFWLQVPHIVGTGRGVARNLFGGYKILILIVFHNM